VYQKMFSFEFEPSNLTKMDFSCEFVFIIGLDGDAQNRCALTTVSIILKIPFEREGVLRYSTF